MTLDEIVQNWKKDSIINQLEAGRESLRFTELHHKYYTILSYERIKLKKMSGELKVLKLQKFEFYTQGPDDESDKKGWKLPVIGKILRSDVPLYMEGDKDIIDATIKIGIQMEKVDYLDSVIKGLTTRGFAIKNFLDDQKQKNGG